jgi:hypothetical protein
MADNTYDTRILPKLLQPILESNAACTRLKGKVFKGAMHSHYRYVGNHLITRLHNRFYKVGVSDSQCGFRVFTRQALEKLKLEATGMEFATDMLIKARHAGLRIAEVPITYYPWAEGAPSKLKKLQRRLAPRRINAHLHPQTPLPIPRPRTNHPRHSVHGHSPHKRPNRLQPRHPHLNNRRNGHHNWLQPTPPRRHSRPHTSQKTRPTTSSNNPKIKKLTPTKAVAIGVTLMVISIIYLFNYLFAWGESGYRRLPLRGENMITLTSIALSIELITSNFVLKSMS